MIKKLAFLLIPIFLLSGVNNIKKELSQTKTVISKMNDKLDQLAKKITQKEQTLKKLNDKIKTLNKEIKKLEVSLKNSNQILSEFKDLKKGHEKRLKIIQDEINDFLSTNYYISSQEIDNINDLIYNELNKKILQQYSEKIENLLSSKENLKKEINTISYKIKTIENRKETLKNKKQKLLKLLKKRKQEIAELKKQKKEYKRKLYTMIKKQQNLQNKLKELLIIRKRKQQEKIAKIPTKIYRGMKTVAPLRGRVVKKFGSYIDPIYKIKIYNDSITIKPYQKNSVVRSILPGKIVYIGKSSGKNIIVIKHKNNIFSIYANLSKVSPLLKKGKYVKRGQIIARVEDALEFEVTYKEKPINPLKVISIK